MSNSKEPTIKEALDYAANNIKHGEVERGRKALNWVLKRDPDNVLALLWMTRCYKNKDTRLKCFKRVLEIDPTNEHAIKGIQMLGGETKPESSPQVAEIQGSAEVLPLQGQDIQQVSLPQTSDLIPSKIETPQILGIVGSLLLITGIFTPILSVPLLGGISYLDFGIYESILIALLSVITIVLLILRKYEAIWITGLGLFGFFIIQLGYFGYQLYSIRTEAKELDAGLFDGLFDLVAEAFRPDWGWAILLLGTGLVLVVPVIWRERKRAWKNIAVGVTLALFLPISSFLVHGNLSDTAGDFTASAGGDELSPRALGGEKKPIPVGESIKYDFGELKILQLHKPTGYLVVESFSFDHNGVEAISGTTFVSIEFEFICADTQVVCESIPSASLEILLADGRTVDDDWNLADAPELGSEDVVSGGSVKGWRVFRVPDDGTMDKLVVDPFDGPKQYASLPDPLDGFSVEHPWYEGENQIKIQALPALRREIETRGLDAGFVMRVDGDSGTILSTEICDEPSFYFDEEDALADYRQLILTVSEFWPTYGMGAVGIFINVSDCSSISINEVNFTIRREDLDKWEAGAFSDTDLLNKVRVSLD